ncbi:unnamed protein product [Polarella glacialis]|uniref:GST C-terminal domain-containing protein n=1 Tax=Polarella glacialis TaxID=89957 RepID=A0A813GKW7_POLGL|nr:unnamed protein product [Polarella glacialis]
MEEATCAASDPEKKKRDLELNGKMLDSILKAASGILETRGEAGFLFGAELTTADVYLLSVFRIFLTMYPAKLEEVCEMYPKLKDYWHRALARDEVQEGLVSYTSKKHMAWIALTRGMVSDILGVKTGLLRAPALPAELETRLQEATRKLRLLLNLPPKTTTTGENRSNKEGEKEQEQEQEEEESDEGSEEDSKCFK